MSERSVDGLISGLVSAAVFLLSFFVLNLGTGLSIVVGIVSFVVALIFFSSPSKTVSEDAHRRLSLQDGQKKLAEIRAYQKLIAKPEMVAQIRSVVAVVEQILKAIQKDPSKLAQSHQFLNYYLDSTITILKKYQDLSSTLVSDEGIKTSLERVEKVFRTLKDAFEKQLVRLMTNDVIDLDTEIALLEQTIKMEGFGN